MTSLLNSFVFPRVDVTYDKNTTYVQFLPRDDGYQIPIRHYVKDKQLPTLLVSHGNRSDIGDSPTIGNSPTKLAERLNCNVLVWDFAGYGLHTKKTPSEKDIEKDILVVYNYLQNKKINNIYVC